MEKDPGSEAAPNSLLECIELLSQEAKGKILNFFLWYSFFKAFLHFEDLYLGTSVQEMDTKPDSPLQFFRDFVSSNKPVIFRGGARHWPAMTKWTNSYLRCDFYYFSSFTNFEASLFLRESLGSEPITVTITPDGYADAVKNGKFVMPYETTMLMN